MASLNPEHVGNGGGGALSRVGTAGHQPPVDYLEEGDIFRTLGLPDAFIIGLDVIAMTTSKSLAGFRDIPPGAHFLWVQQRGGVSRCGHWFVTERPGTVRIKEWDRYNEVLGEPAGQSEVGNHTSNLASEYAKLQPYTLHDHGEKTPTVLNDTRPDWARSRASLWNALTSAISTRSLSRITGRQQDVGEYFVDSMDSVKDTSHGANPSSHLNFLFTQDLRDLQVLNLGSMKAHVADTSARVQALLSNTNTANTTNPITEHDILAELQFTFLTGTHLSNTACLEQWWDLLLKIVLRAYTLAVARPTLARDLFRTLHAQLFYTEHYFGSSASADGHAAEDGGSDKGQKDGPSADRLIFQYKPRYREKLRHMLVGYKHQLGELLRGLGDEITAEQEAVGRVFEDLEAWLWRWGWDLRGGDSRDDTIERREEAGGGGDEVPPDSDEEEDEQPVVVELDEEGREVGLVSFRD